MMQQDWNIKSRSDTCQVTNLPFAEGDFFYTLLFWNEEESQRVDLSESAWEQRKQDETAPVPFSHWRSKYEAPPPPTPEPLPKDDAEGMLRYFLKQQDPKHQNVCYILALMLERKKLLRPLPSPEKTTLLYEHIVTGETFILTDPQLSLENLVSVQQEVSELLGAKSSLVAETRL
ncbi:MAG: hypothetical protein FJ390_06970 [Verrucomicrobia bacterium]|nr:hypothetical protein [Verrucomicrobiota bacterium]